MSLWEIAIKQNIGKLQLQTTFDDLISQQVRGNGFEILSIELHHLRTFISLPLHHRDPFDRLIIAQAIAETLPIISADSAFDPYPISRIW